MPQEDNYVARTQVIRACLAEHPGATPARVVGILAERDIKVSPAHVIVVQEVLRSEKPDRTTAAS